MELSEHRQQEGDDEYATPAQIWRPLSRAVDGFELDPASGAEPVPIASKRYTKEDDGLTQEWFGDVWLNPPWSSDGSDVDNPKHRWLRKVRREVKRDAVRTVTVLCPNDTSTHWFHEHLVHAEVMCFVGPGRIPFEGEDRNPSFGMIIAVFGEVDAEMIMTLNGFGAVFQGSRIHDDGQMRFGGCE